MYMYRVTCLYNYDISLYNIIYYEIEVKSFDRFLEIKFFIKIIYSSLYLTKTYHTIRFMYRNTLIMYSNILRKGKKGETMVGQESFDGSPVQPCQRLRAQAHTPLRRSLQGWQTLDNPYTYHVTIHSH